MSLNPEALSARLNEYVDPLIGSGLVDAGLLDALEIDGDNVSVRLVLPFAAAAWHAQLEAAVVERLKAAGAQSVVVQIRQEITASPVPSQLDPLPGVRNIIAVASGKGGVGKSTVAANLALSLAAEGGRVGVIDADIYGPSQPRMLGVAGARPVSPDGKVMQPVSAHGLQVMSIGFLVDEEAPTIWRGPMVSQALQQLIGGTRWENLDYLVIDLPPGTGDVQLSLAQRVPLSGAVIVTTPQDIALLDARKGLKMFERVGVPVLGVVENMSTHVCSNCGHEEPIFGRGGGESLARQYGVALLGSLPLDLRIREQADGGCPTVAAEPDGELAAAYRQIARQVAARLVYGGAEDFPQISESED